MKKIILIIIAVIICAGGITVVVINNNNKKNEPVTSSNQISSSDSQINKTSNNSIEISKEDIEEYIKNINNRNIDDIMNMYDIDGINEYKKEISNSDERISESDLKNRIIKEIDRWERYEEINYKLTKFDIVHDISDIEEMHKKMGSENPNITDEYRNKVNKMLENYIICYPYFTRTVIYKTGEKVEEKVEEVPGQIIWNKKNGKIVQDFIIVL